MKQSLWLNVVLLVAVVAAGAFVFLRSPADAPVEYAVSRITPAAAAALRIERSGARTVVAEKRNGTWFLTAPFDARADEFMIQRILAILQARTIHRFASTDLARFDLEKPRARLVIDGQSFDFGMVSELSREQYVLTADAVYALSPRYGLALPLRPDALASRQLFAPDEKPVRISPPGFTVARSGQSWAVEPAHTDWSQDELKRWADAWRAASALRIEPYRDGEASESVRIVLNNGKELVIGVLSRKPEFALLRPDQNLQYYFAEEVGDRLLSAPGTKRTNSTDKH